MLYEPSISTVDQPGYEMGQKAAQLLFSKIDSPTKVRAKTVIIKTKVLKEKVPKSTDFFTSTQHSKNQLLPILK